MWKTVIIDKGERITLDSGWLVVSVTDKEARVPIEDVYSVIIDNKAAVLSTSVITALTDSGTHIIVCDDKHYMRMKAFLTQTICSCYNKCVGWPQNRSSYT